MEQASPEQNAVGYADLHVASSQEGVGKDNPTEHPVLDMNGFEPWPALLFALAPCQFNQIILREMFQFGEESHFFLLVVRFQNAELHIPRDSGFPIAWNFLNIFLGL